MGERPKAEGCFAATKIEKGGRSLQRYKVAASKGRDLFRDAPLQPLEVVLLFLAEGRDRLKIRRLWLRPAPVLVVTVGEREVATLVVPARGRGSPTRGGGEGESTAGRDVEGTRPETIFVFLDKHEDGGGTRRDNRGMSSFDPWIRTHAIAIHVPAHRITAAAKDLRSRDE